MIVNNSTTLMTVFPCLRPFICLLKSTIRSKYSLFFILLYTLGLYSTMTIVNLVKPLYQRTAIVPGFMDIDPKLEAYKSYLKSKVVDSIIIPTPKEVYSWIEYIVLFVKNTATTFYEIRDFFFLKKK